MFWVVWWGLRDADVGADLHIFTPTHKYTRRQAQADARRPDTPPRPHLRRVVGHALGRGRGGAVWGECVLEDGWTAALLFDCRVDDPSDGRTERGTRTRRPPPPLASHHTATPKTHSNPTEPHKPNFRPSSTSSSARASTRFPSRGASTSTSSSTSVRTYLRPTMAAAIPKTQNEDARAMLAVACETHPPTHPRTYRPRPTCSIHTPSTPHTTQRPSPPAGATSAWPSPLTRRWRWSASRSPSPPSPTLRGGGSGGRGRAGRRRPPRDVATVMGVV